MVDSRAAAVRGFRRSSFCRDANCVEVAALPGDDVLVRDNKDPRADAPALRFSPSEWEAFVAGVQAGEFSLTALKESTTM